MSSEESVKGELEQELAKAKQRIADLEARITAEDAVRDKHIHWILVALDKAGLGVWDWDLRMNKISWADTTLRIYGLTREDFDGTYEAFISRVHPDDRERSRTNIRRVLEGPEGSCVIEHRIIRKDGAIRWTQGYGIAFFDENGKAYRLAGVTQDITQLKEEAAERERMQERVIEAQREALRQLGAPIIPLAANALAMPLVGTLTPERTMQVTETLLEAVTTRAAEHVILDVTGVAEVDTDVADGLLRVAQAVRLLGAEVALTGMQPAVARALVDLGVDMTSFVTKADLQSGIQWASRRGRR